MPPREGTASRREACRLGARPRFPPDVFPCHFPAELPKIEVRSGLIRAVEGGRELTRDREGALLSNRETALMLPIV